MSTVEPKQLLELYDTMEANLDKIGISFDEFTILYKSFKTTLPPTTKKELKKPNPFPWVKHAGAGWS